MPEDGKLKILVTAMLIILFAASGTAVGILASNITREIQAASIRDTYYKKIGEQKQRRSSGKMMAQLENAGTARLLPAATVAVPRAPQIDCFYTEPEKPEYKAEWLTNSARFWTVSGNEFEVSVYARNTGNVPWFSDNSSCGRYGLMRLGTARDRDRESIFYTRGSKSWISPNRVKMTEARVNPGETATFRFSAKAPAEKDIYREYFQLVIEGKTWIPNKEAAGFVDIYVGPNPWEKITEYQERLNYLNRTGQASKFDISGEKMIDVDISDQKMLVKFGDAIIREYTVSTGTFKTPTPLGRFAILNKFDLRIGAKWPYYHMPQWQGFTKWGHGLHALPYLANDKGVFWNEALNHIGIRVSHGCIRLLPDDAVDLYNLTEVGWPVVVHA